jgi:cytochrome c
MIGKIAASLLVATLAAVPAVISAQASGPDGAAVFRQRCAACHSVAPAARAVLAPNLAGVVGRKAGSTAFNYSTALKNSNLVWNRANLDRYLTAPARTVPGTRMVVSVTDAAQRAALLNYLTRPTR